MYKRGSRLLRRVIFTTALANVRSKRNGDKTNKKVYEEGENLLKRDFTTIKINEKWVTGIPISILKKMDGLI